MLMVDMQDVIMMEKGAVDGSNRATLNLKVPFPTAREADIAYNSLRVDGEPKRSQVVKTLSVQGNNLVLFLENMTIEEHTPTPQEARGIYGFVLFLFIKVSLFFYFVWMFMPISLIKSLPYAPPQQYWGIAVPVFFCTGLFMFAFYIYPACHGLYDGNFDEPSAITDPDAHAEDYLVKIRAKAMILKPQQRRKRSGSGKPSLKAMKVSAEIYEKSRTLSAKEKRYKEMQIQPMRSFPECDTKPIPHAHDLDLDLVCKRVFLQD